MICNNKKQVFMGGSPKAKSTDFTPAFFLLQGDKADTGFLGNFFLGEPIG